MSSGIKHRRAIQPFLFVHADSGDLFVRILDVVVPERGGIFEHTYRGEEACARDMLVSCYFRVLLRNLLSALWVRCIMAPCLMGGDTES